MNTTPDTLVTDTDETEERDPQHIGSGSSHAPGGANAPVQDANQMSQGQEGYPGARSGGENDKPGATPPAADTDPASTASAQATGQDGSWSTTRSDPEKNTANPWNG